MSTDTKLTDIKLTAEQIAMYNNLLDNIGSHIQTQLKGSTYNKRSLSYRNVEVTLALRILNEKTGVIVGYIYKNKVLNKSINYSMSLRSSNPPQAFITQLIEEIH